MAPQCGVFINVSLFDILIIADIQVLVDSIVAVRMMIALKLGVDADLGVVSCAVDVVWVGAGQAAIARLTARLPAVVRIPVVGAVVFLDECFQVLAVGSVITVFVNLFRADGLMKNLNILCFCASLIDVEDPV